MKSLIVVPARYGSTRFAGKPLALINGVSMVRRTANVAQRAAQTLDNCDYVVATDDNRIAAHCQKYGLSVVMTPPDSPTGSDRALSAVKIYAQDTDFVVNLQGDAPFTPVSTIIAIIKALNEGAQVATPYTQLSWSALDKLREQKRQTPFSGTSVLIGQDNRALMFSKNIIPALRGEQALREQSPLSPICRHIGLYGYRLDVLERFVSWPESHYERLEGLEQLRLLENDVPVDCVRVEPPRIATSGIDTPEDIARAEALIAVHGDPFEGPI